MPYAQKFIILTSGKHMMLIRFYLILVWLSVSGCSHDTTSEIKYGTAGNAGEHTPVVRDSSGNILGYMEYLPKEFDADKQYPIVIYWNGINAINGNGIEDLPRLFTQGLPKLINEKHHFKTIILSPMIKMPDWDTKLIHEFVSYALARYDKNIDLNRVYMSGFSAGGGITIQYAADYPNHLAAIVPVSPATAPPNEDQPSKAMASIPSWIFHNSGDLIVEIWRSNLWHKALKDSGGNHKITRPDLDTHYAWKETYTSSNMWEWLLSQSKPSPKTSSNND